MMVPMKDQDGNPVEVPLGQAVQPIVRQEISNARKAGRARGDGGGGETTAIESAMQDAEWAAENPTQAEALAVAHSSINGLAPVFNWDGKKTKQLHQQVIDLAKQGEDLMAFIQRLQGGRLLGAPGGGGQSGARSGPGQF
jgi:PHP family Zn ribbon phosphoesterase